MRRTSPPSVRRRQLQGRRDDGQANVLLLFGLTLSLLSLTLLFVRVGAANDMRSQAQTAADAAVLAAVSALRDHAAEQLADGLYPLPRYDEEVAESRAETYAKNNGAVLTDIRASDNSMGRFGNIVRVEIRGAVCQKELAEDGSRDWNDVVCDGEEDDSSSFEGTAAAIAIIELTAGCGRNDDGITCDGRAVTDAEEAADLFDVHLIDQEGQYKFDPDVVFGGGAVVDCSSLGALHPQMCETHKVLNHEFPGFYLSAGGYRPGLESDHGWNQAVDYMMADAGQKPTPEMHATALKVVDYLMENHQELNVKGIIYNYRIWNPLRDSVGSWEQVSRKAKVSGNLTLDHVDHIHLSVGPPPFR
ncbi:pilus assembly protein TadG-related protein [Nocardiopsis ganjiahuensis]|uniref:pilus assembly protein TadG-related protein n=1 Tax=Nocardiopsis ganjiahuensis TaxID=239984 RepID=UPI000345FF1B|nr:pilus assembly protein TadG-related protein [Nocardiopsis ganjiahuensis]